MKLHVKRLYGQLQIQLYFQELKDDIMDLFRNVFPWKPTNELFTQEKENQVTIEDIRSAIKKIVSSEDRARPNDIREDKPTSMEELQGIVTHFQTLFDVKSITGVFPRMNEVYSKVGEAYNVMKTIRETLSLGLQFISFCFLDENVPNPCHFSLSYWAFLIILSICQQ